MKPEITITPASWSQLGSGADLVVTWDASSVAGFSSVGVLVGTSPGDSDLGSAVSMDSTDSFTVLAGDLPGSGLIHLTLFLDYDQLATYSRIIRPASWPDHDTVGAELADRFAIEDALSAVTNDEVETAVGTNWLGLQHIESVGSDEDLRSSANLGGPTMWARWAIAYSEEMPVVCLDDEHAVTSGAIVIDVYFEKGSSVVLAQLVLSLYRQALKDYEAASDYTFSVEAPSETLTSEQLAALMVQRLAIHFRGL